MEFAYLEVVLPSTEVQMDVWHQVVALHKFGLYLEVGKCKVGHQVGKHSVYLEVPSYTWRCTLTLDRCTWTYIVCTWR